MDIQSILVYLIMFLCIFYAGKHFLFFFKKGKKNTTICNSGCSGCKLAQSKSCNEKKMQKSSAKHC